MEYAITVQSGKTIMFAKGDLKTSEASSFHKELLGALKEHQTVILDMAGVSYICSAGLRALLAGQQYIDSVGVGDLILRNLTPEVESVIKATGFNNVLTIV